MQKFNFYLCLKYEIIHESFNKEKAAPNKSQLSNWAFHNRRSSNFTVQRESFIYKKVMGQNNLNLTKTTRKKITSK